MFPTGRARLLIAAVALSAGGSAPAMAASSATTPTVDLSPLRASASLWATINVCSPTDQPDTVGIRGSMPSDGHATDRMYMSFRLQHETTEKKWVDILGVNARTGYLFVGRGATRQDGASFQLVPVPGDPAMTLRGVVTFQWRRKGVVVASLSRPTTAPHASKAGADPAGFSVASCVIG
jgi:hypothetical protein